MQWKEKYVVHTARVAVVCGVVCGAWVVCAEDGPGARVHRNLFEPASTSIATTAPATRSQEEGFVAQSAHAGERARTRAFLEERRASLRTARTQTSPGPGGAYVHAGQYVTRMTERMSGALERLKRITDRVASRIEKAEAMGADVATARATLDEVYPLMESARIDIAYVGQVAASLLAADVPRTRVEELRDAALVARDGLVAVHAALTDTVYEIRSGILRSATTTPVLGVPDAATTAPAFEGTSSNFVP